MDIEKAAFGLIENIYDAAMAPEKWQQVMSGLADTLGTKSALLREVNYTSGSVGLYKTYGFDPTFTKAYREHFVHLDYFAPALMREPVGKISTGDQEVPWEQQRDTEFCNDYLLAQKSRYCLGITLARQHDYHLLFALQRTQQQGDFTADDLPLLRLLAPHMTRAMVIHRHMLAVTTQQQWALSALDKLKIGVLLLDERGKPGFINQKAEQLMSAGCGLSVNRDTLSLTNTFESARLERLIANAAMAASGFMCNAGGSLRTNSLSGESLIIQVIPLPRESERSWGLAFPSGCVAVFVSTSGATHLRVESLSSLYGLTLAEAKLASLLAHGLSLEQAASTSGISIQTVRSQLKAVFAKTHVSRQAELVARLLADMLSHQLID